MNMLFIKTGYAATPKAKDVISNSIVLKCMADYLNGKLLVEQLIFTHCHQYDFFFNSSSHPSAPKLLDPACTLCSLYYNFLS